MKFAALRAHPGHHSFGYLALFVGAGGTSYAAVRLAPSSVTPREVNNGSLLRMDLKRGRLLAGARCQAGPPHASRLRRLLQALYEPRIVSAGRYRFAENLRRGL